MNPVQPAPAPWNVAFADGGASGSGPHVYITDKDGRKIAAVWGKREEKLRTAAMIIAAPDLLECVKKLERTYESIWIKISDGEAAALREAWAAVDVAISVAEGRV